MFLEGSEHEFDATIGSWATNPFKALSYNYKLDMRLYFCWRNNSKSAGEKENKFRTHTMSTAGQPDNFSLPNDSSATLRKVLSLHFSVVQNVWAACSL